MARDRVAAASENATGEGGPAAGWRQAARAFFEARGFAPGSPFRAIAEALADGFAASPAPFRLPLALALALADEAEALAAFAGRDGPSDFADARLAVAAVAVEFPQVTVEHARVTLNMLGQAGLLESAYREIDPATGAATAVPAVDLVALLRRCGPPGPNAAIADRLARIVLDRWPVP